MILHVLVYAVCAAPKDCRVHAHSSYETEKECEKVMLEQNAFWKKHKVIGKVYCIKSMEELERVKN